MELMAIASLGFGVAFLLLGWPAYAIAALGLAVFCAIIPRMKGPFGLRVEDRKVLFGGTLDDPQGVVLKAEVSEAGEDPRAEGRASLSNRESLAD